jgi:hypothetical protein
MEESGRQDDTGMEEAPGAVAAADGGADAGGGAVAGAVYEGQYSDGKREGGGTHT